MKTVLAVESESCEILACRMGNEVYGHLDCMLGKRVSEYLDLRGRLCLMLRML